MGARVGRPDRPGPSREPGFHLGHVAEIETAKRRTAGHPTPLPTEARDLLHLAAIEAWQALANGEPTPDIDPLALQQAVYEAFTAGNSISPVEQLREDWSGLARRCGILVDDEHGDLLPDVDDAITRTVTAAIWFGITTRVPHPDRQLPHPPHVPLPLARTRTYCDPRPGRGEVCRASLIVHFSERTRVLVLWNFAIKLTLEHLEWKL